MENYKGIKAVALHLVLLSSAMGKVDVNYSTGQMSFSESMAKVVGRRLAYDVKLKYNSDIKRGHGKDETAIIVPERASWAGLGFELDVPYIERSIVGPPDNARSANRWLAWPQRHELVALRDELAREGNRLYWNYYNYRPLVFRTSTGYGTNYHEKSYWDMSDGSLSEMVCLPGRNYQYTHYECNTCVPLALTEDYVSCPLLNQQSQQDGYNLRGFPGGNGRLYFTMVQSAEGKLLANVAPYRSWEVDYIIEEPAEEDTNTEILEWHIIDDHGTRYIFGGTTATGVDARVWLDGTDTWGTKYRKAQLTRNVLASSMYGAQDNPAYSAAEKFHADRTVERWYLRRIETYDRKDSVVFDYRAIAEPVMIADNPYVCDVNKWQELPPSYFEYDIEMCISNSVSRDTLVTFNNGYKDLATKTLTIECQYLKVLTRSEKWDPITGDEPRVHMIPLRTGTGTFYFGYAPTSISIQLVYTGSVRFEGRPHRAFAEWIMDTLCLKPHERLPAPLGPGWHFRLTENQTEDCLTMHGPYFEEMKDGLVQAVLRDESRRYSQTLSPASIATELQKVEFVEQVEGQGARSDQGPLGRGRLSEIVLYDITAPGGQAVEQQRISFEHTNGGLPFRGRLQLRDLYVSTPASRAANKRRRLYHFGYRRRPGVADVFGRVNIGLLDTVVDVNGGTTIAEYEKGSYVRLSNNTTVPHAVEHGWRVSRLTRRGGFDAPDIVKNIHYHRGEVNYGSGLKYVYEEPFWCGLDTTLKWLNDGLGDGYSFAYSLNRYSVHYGAVRVSAEGADAGNYRVYQYLQSDASGLSDEENEYNVNAAYRYRIKSVGQYGARSDVTVKRTVYHYEVADVVADMVRDLSISQEEARRRLRYSKPVTRVDQFQVRTCTPDEPYFYPDLLEYFYPDRAFGISGLLGLAADTVVRSSAVRVKRVESYVHGRKSVTEYEYNARGQVAATKQSGPSHPGVTLTQKRTYGHDLERELNPIFVPDPPDPVTGPIRTPCELEGTYTRDEMLSHAECGCEEDTPSSGTGGRYYDGEPGLPVPQGEDAPGSGATYTCGGGSVSCYDIQGSTDLVYCYQVPEPTDDRGTEPIGDGLMTATEEHIPENSFFLRYNVFAPVVLNQTQEMRAAWDDPVTLAASFNVWQASESGEPAYPTKEYVWAVEHNDDGYPESPFTLDTRLEPLKQEPSAEWHLQSEVTKRDAHVKTLEQRSAGGARVASKIYRSDLNALVASVSAATYDECAAYTCDYDLGNGSGYLDGENGWGRGAVHDASGDLALSTAKPHFGLKSLHVKNSYGPTRNVSLTQGRDYEFWAWVYPTVAAGRMTVEFRMSATEQDPADRDRYIGAWTLVVSDLPLDQWSPLRLQIKADQIADHLLEGYEVSQVDYVRVWIGNGSQNEAPCDFYVDDIRFHPSNALMTTKYYYDRAHWSLPRLSVGPDGNPSPLTEYNEFGMPAKTWQFSHDGQHVLLNELEYYVKGDDAP